MRYTVILILALFIIIGNSTILAQAVILDNGQNGISLSYDISSTTLEFSDFFAGPQTAGQDWSQETSHYRLAGTVGGRLDAGVDFWNIHNSDRDYLGFDVEFMIVKNHRVIFPLSVGLYSSWQFTIGETRRKVSIWNPGIRLYIKTQINRSTYIMPFIGGGPIYYSNYGDDGLIAIRSGFYIYTVDKSNMYFSLWPYFEFYDD